MLSTHDFDITKIPTYSVQKYDKKRTTPLFQELILPSLMRLVGDVSSLRILDVGCGDGFYSKLFAERGAQEVIGIDCFDEAISKAQVDAPRNAKFIQTQIDEYQDEKKFDVILCNFVLCYSKTEEELQAILNNLFKLMKPGGKLCGIDDTPSHKMSNNLEKYGIFYPNMVENPEEFPTTITYKYEDYEITFRNHRYSQDVWERVFSKAGFQDFKWVNFQPIKNQQYFEQYVSNPKDACLFARKFTEEDLIHRAIHLAHENVVMGKGGPFGAVIVDENGKIIGEGTNLVVNSNDPTAHAEVLAIKNACANIQDFKLDNCTLYASCEPCPMCLGAIYWSKLKRVVFGADRNDAASIGFDDEFIYQEFSKELHLRSITITSHKFIEQQHHEEIKLKPFKQWIFDEQKVHY